MLKAHFCATNKVIVTTLSLKTVQKQLPELVTVTPFQIYVQVILYWAVIVLVFLTGSLVDSACQHNRQTVTECCLTFPIV